MRGSITYHEIGEAIQSKDFSDEDLSIIGGNDFFFGHSSMQYLVCLLKNTPIAVSLFKFRKFVNRSVVTRSHFPVGTSNWSRKAAIVLLSDFMALYVVWHCGRSSQSGTILVTI